MPRTGPCPGERQLGKAIRAILLTLACGQVMPGMASCHAQEGLPEDFRLDRWLPEADPRVPWSLMYKDYRYAPALDAIEFQGSWEYSPEKVHFKGRADVTETISVGRGFFILDWKEQKEQHWFSARRYGDPKWPGAWSPDGSTLAQVTDTAAATNVWLYVRATRDLRLLSQVPTRDVSNPVWSPDSERVAVFVGKVPETEHDDAKDAAGQPVDGASGGSMDLNDQSGYAGSLRVFDVRDDSVQSFKMAETETNLGPGISWSPSGAFVAVGTYAPEGAMRLQMFSPTAGRVAAEHLVRSRENTMRAVWSSDSRYLALSGDDVYIAQIGPEGDVKSERVVPLVQKARHIAWIPGTTQLLLSIETDVRTFGDVLQGVPGIMENPPKRQKHAAWRLDATTGLLETDTGFSEVSREEWSQPWMLPRVAEAFAQWSH